MGLTVLNIEVGNPSKPEATVPVEFLIDSGAIYSVVPSSILESLGIKPLAEQEFRLANGERIVRKTFRGRVYKYLSKCSLDRKKHEAGTIKNLYRFFENECP